MRTDYEKKCVEMIRVLAAKDLVEAKKGAVAFMNGNRKRKGERTAMMRTIKNLFS